MMRGHSDSPFSPAFPGCLCRTSGLHSCSWPDRSAPKEEWLSWNGVERFFPAVQPGAGPVSRIVGTDHPSGTAPGSAAETDPDTADRSRMDGATDDEVDYEFRDPETAGDSEIDLGE